MRTGRPCSNTEETFWASVDRSGGAEACWPWMRTRSPRGYGKTYYKGKDWRANRLAHFFATGEKPACVLHTCDNPPCCNPKHLRSGDHKLNAIDRAAKSRGYKPKGAKHHHAILTDEIVMAIRRERAAGAGPAEIGKKYDLHPMYVSQITRGVRWTHLPVIEYPGMRRG